MDNTYRFTEFSKQSPKGIIIIYFNLLYRIFKASWVLLIVFTQGFSKLSDATLIYIYIGTGIVLLLLLLRAFLLYENFQFKIENNHFILKQGVLKKTNTSVPFDRIQNVNFKQNLIQQLVNVYQVNIETAGSKGTEIAIKALSYNKAQSIKQQISLSKDTAISNSIVNKKPLLKISFAELLKVSLTENHIKSFLLFIALLFGVYQQIKDVFEELQIKETSFFNSLDEKFNTFSENIIILVFLFIIFLVIALITSLIRVFLFHFNLIVFIKNQSFEINQGLLTKKSIILKKEKVQNITISTNPIKKKFGISFVVFKQAVSGKVNKKKNKLIKIVGCNANQIIKIKELLFDFKPVEGAVKQRPDNYYKTRMYFRSTLVIILLNFILYINFQDTELFLINLLVLPIILLFINIKIKKTFYKISDDLLLIGSGSIETHHTYFPFFKVQNIKVKQTIFQKRKGVVDIIFQTASGKIKIPCIKKEKAIEIYNYTLYKVENSKKLWM